MAGRAEEGIGDAYNVSLSVSLLAADILASLPDYSVGTAQQAELSS